MLEAGLADLLALLRLERAGPDRWIGSSPEDRDRRVYGGQVLAQALLAAQQMCDECGNSLHARSLHAYFVHAGDPQAPILYQASTLLTGEPSHLRIDAMQGDRTMSTMDAVFSADFADPVDVPMPHVAPPERAITRSESLALIRSRATGRFDGWNATAAPFETRFASDIWHPSGHAPRHETWFRAAGTGAPEPMYQALALYFSDDTIMDNALLPHGGVFAWQEIQSTSLDHAMWFHRPFDPNDWHLFAQDSPVSWGGRGFTRGVIFDRAGRPVATAAQEILMRRRRS